MSDEPEKPRRYLTAEEVAHRFGDPLAIRPVVAPADTKVAANGATREQRRSRRKRAVRAVTVSVKRMTKRDLELGRLLYPDEGNERPKTRAECIDGPRPCPFVSCHHHLYVDVSPVTGSIKMNFPDIEVQEMRESCALDVADRGGTTLEDVGEIMNVTRERVRQVEVKALAKIERLREAHDMYEELDAIPSRPPTGLVAAQQLWAPAGKVVRLHPTRSRKRRLPVLPPDVDRDFDVIEGLDDEDEQA